MDNSVDIGRLLAGIAKDPAISGALVNLLGGLSGGGGAADTSENVSPSSREYSAVPDKRVEERAPVTHGGTADLLSVLGGLLGSASGTSSEKDAVNREDLAEKRGADPMRKLLGGKAEAENRIKLLNALRPYLGDERRAKLDVLLRLLKIAELGQLSGLLNSFSQV